MIMKLRNLFACVVASAMALVACEELVDLGVPAISLDTSEISFEKDGGDATVAVTASRDWTVTLDAETSAWLVVDPASGTASAEAQTVTLTALPNDGYSREASVAFTIGMQTKYLTVKQDGGKGSADDLIVYANDMDNGKVEKVNDKWPYPDQSDSWRNEKGSGIADVKYSSDGVSVRSVSSTNNLWFPAKGGSYFSVQDIALNSTTSLELTFDAVHGSPNGYKKEFATSAFKVYVSKDKTNWVELPYELTVKADNEFDTGAARFTVDGVENLSVTFQFLGAEDGYRLTHLSLSVYDGTDAAAVDFSKAVAMDFAVGTNGGTPTPENVTDVTIAEFNEKPVSTTEWYRLTGTVGGPINTEYGNYDLIDATGKVYVYGTSNWSEYSSQFVEGATVTIVGQRGDYNGKVEVLESYIESFSAEGGNTDGGETPAPDAPEIPASLTSVSDFLAASVGDTWYKVKGQIVNIEKETYGNLTIKDEAGDELYVYGMTKEYAVSNDQSFASIGLKVGYYVTFVAKRGEYNGNPQATGAFYVSHEVGELDLGADVNFTKLTAAPSDWTGTYLIYMADNKVHAAVSGKDLTAVSEELSDNGGVIAAPEAYAVQVADAGNGLWSVKLPNGKYLGLAHNSCTSSDEPVALGFEWTAAGVKISGEATNKGTTSTYYLYYSTNNGEYIRFYVDKSSDDRYTLPTLYKK